MQLRMISQLPEFRYVGDRQLMLTLSDIFCPVRTKITAYCRLFSIWTDKYDAQTLFSVHT